MHAYSHLTEVMFKRTARCRLWIYLLTVGVYLHALSVPDSPNCVTVPRKSVLSAAGMGKRLILRVVSESQDLKDAADSYNLLYFIGTVTPTL